MTPRVSFAKTRLDYPLYAADFDPYGRGYLLVSGGGGESKTGVANKISVLDVANPSTIDKVAEIGLSHDEDSPNTLASLATKDGLITFAGVNSSIKDQQAGKNQHFCSFVVDYPAGAAEIYSAKRKRTKASETEKPVGRIAPYGRVSLFKPDKRAKPEAYQRVLRLSPARRSEAGSKRLGAIATGLGEVNEVLIFNATSAAPTEQDVIQRITPKDNAEANDVDLIDVGNNEFRWAYCMDQSVYVGTIKYDFEKKRATGDVTEPEQVHTMIPSGGSTGSKPLILRNLRFLTPNYLLMSSNIPGFKGVQLCLLKTFPHGGAEVVLRKKLAGHVKAATGMDVCVLNADPVTGALQIIVAVAGADKSVTLLTLDYHGKKSDSMSTFRTVSVTKDVHELQITGIRLSPFHPPASGQKATGKQHVYLATISIGNTVVVDTLPLESVTASDKSKRYILSSTSSAVIQTGATTLVVGFVMLIFLLALQGFVAANYPDSALGKFQLHEYIPEPVRDVLGSMAPPGSRSHSALKELEDIINHQMYPGRRLKDIFDHFSSEFHFRPSSPAGQAGSSVVVIRNPDPNSDDPDSYSLSTEFHPNKDSLIRGEPEAKRWEDLDHDEKEHWKKTLIDAGAWAVDEGETVLRGIFFSSYAGAVGDIVGEMLR